jgi:hypothetical protein
MITHGSTRSRVREAGVVYTKPRMVELVLNRAGYPSPISRKLT